MKIIFLDIDGVLNSHAFLQSLPKGVAFDKHEHMMLDGSAIGRLNKIIEASGAKVVVSSSWRLAHPLDSIKSYLQKRGFVGEIVGITPWNTGTGIRGLEIQAWLDANPHVESFVILDDDSDMAHLKPKLIRTSFAFGLEDAHIDRAVEALHAPYIKER